MMRAPRSVRMRLTLWYVAALSVIVLTYASITYAIVYHSLLKQLERHLDRDYSVAEQSLYRTSRGEIAWSPPRYFPEKGPIDAKLTIEIWRPGGILLFRHRIGAGEDTGSAAPPRAAALFFSTPHYESVAVGRLPFRARSGQVTLGNETLIIRVMRSEERMYDDLLGLAGWMMVGLPIALMLAAMGGYFVAARAVDPVVQMIAAARRIHAENLSERLTVIDPDDEMGQLAETFNAMLQRLEQSFIRLRDCASEASHELRAPLAAIRGVGEIVLRERHTPSEYRDAIGSMLEETDRLDGLVDNMMLLARADHGWLYPKMEIIDLGDAAERIVALLRPLAEEKRQSIVLENPAAPQVRADAALLRQAALGILDNAIAYSPPEATVTVSVQERDGSGILGIRDNGPGIPIEEQGRIFERFYRGPLRPCTRDGCGLGLAIAKSLVETMGGRIELESAPGQGTTFRIVLPTAY